MNERPNYYSVIPATVRYDPTLKDKAKLLYSEITSLANKSGECWASNEYFAKLYSVTERAIIKYLQDLKRKNYIDLKYEYKENSKEIKHRIIVVVGGEQMFSTYGTNVQGGGEQMFTENNIYINNNYNNRKENTKEKKKIFINILNESNLSENIKLSLTTWLDYKDERNDLYKSEVGFKKLLTIINNQLKNHSEDELIELIDESIANNYKGITFNKLKYRSKSYSSNSTPTTVYEDGMARIL